MHVEALRKSNAKAKAGIERYCVGARRLRYRSLPGHNSSLRGRLSLRITGSGDVDEMGIATVRHIIRCFG